MTVVRPLARLSIVELEALFATSKGDEKALKQMANELGHRTVPRARALLAAVRKTLCGTGNSVASPAATAPEPEPWAQSSHPDKGAETAAPSSAIGPIRKSASEQPKVAAVELSARQPVRTPPAESMTVEEAYKALKAMPGSSWETIEQARRDIVGRACPDRVASMRQERRAHAEAEAKRANAAYAVLRLVRAAKN